MQDFANTKILLGVCGGIAAYKAVFLIRELTRCGAAVRVVMTQAAHEFITPLTMQTVSGNEVYHKLFDPATSGGMDHIELARWADYVLIAPASANFLTKMAYGLADDLLSTLCLATAAPIIVCPAMNKNMWEHPAIQHNCSILKQRQIVFLGPELGMQACGDFGHGRFAEISSILNALRILETIDITAPHGLQQKQIMITAGPTREMIDPVRFISNASSGKMGYSLAIAAHLIGANVTLISGPTNLPKPIGVNFTAVTSAQGMLEQVLNHGQPGMIFIGVAAVADYTISDRSMTKIKKQSHNDAMTINLKCTQDIIATVVNSGLAAYTVGFAAETHDVLLHAREKLQRKRLQMIIANQVGEDLTFEQDQSQATIITKNAEISLPVMHKMRLAGKILNFIHKNITE